MTTLWVAIVAVALANAAIKAAGPVLAGGRELPPRATVVALLAPALLGDLVISETFGEGSAPRARREGRRGGRCGYRSRATGTPAASRLLRRCYHRAGSTLCLTRAMDRRVRVRENQQRGEYAVARASGRSPDKSRHDVCDPSAGL